MRKTPGPLLLVTWDENSRKFAVDQGALSFLKTVEGPLAVVSVAGMYRTGKSFLLNRVFLNKSSAFEVGPSVNPCTKGIWVWGEALPGTAEDGTPCSILIVDTEGIGGLEKDNDYDSRIFSIATLISSCFVYNSTGSIDENAIENLNLIVNISKMIQSSESSSFFPKFVWVVRDFTLKLIDDDGRTIEPNEYLEKVLQLQKGTSESVEAKNKIRKTLTSYFKDRECFTLVRPTIVESDLQKLEKLDPSQMRVEFIEQTLELRRKIMSAAKVKKISSQALNGELLAKLLETYIDTFNSGTIPSIDSTWSYVCKHQNKVVLQKTIEEYEKSLNEIILPVDEAELKSMHSELKKQFAKDLSKKLLTGDEKLVQEFYAAVSQKYSEKKIQNQYDLKMHFMTYLKDQYTELDSGIKSGKFSNLQDLEKNLKIVEKKYYESCLDSEMKNEIFMKFSKEISSKMAEFLISAQSNEIKLLKSIHQEQVTKLSNDLKDSTDLLFKQKNDYEKNLSKLKGDISVAAEIESNLKDQITNLAIAKEKLENNLKELTRSKSAELEDSLKKISALENQLKDVNRNSSFKISEIEDEKALLQQKLMFIENSLEELRSKEKSSLDKIKDLRIENAQTLKSLQTKYEQQIEKINEKLEEKTRENNEIENEVEIKEALLEETQTLLNKTSEELKDIKALRSQEFEDLNRELQDKECLYKKKIEKMEQEFKTSTARIRARLGETEKKLRNSEEMLRNDMAIWAQDNAILVQKIEFLEQEVEEQKIKREEEKKHYLSLISGMETVSSKN